MLPNDPRRTKHQHQTNACTGFALSTAIEYLLDRGQRPCEPISGYMLYSMARRYDEWAEDDDVDSGSSLRGALKGWARHGASAERLWTKLDMPKATHKPDEDCCLDAVKRTMGASHHLPQENMRPAESRLGTGSARSCRFRWFPDTSKTTKSPLQHIYS